VALATLLLPIVYLALVSLAAYAVYLHLAFDTWLLKTTDVTIVHFIGYFGPAVVGGAVVFFMCKPLLARQTDKRVGVPIERADAPLLFELVERVRAAVHAPAPSELRLDTQVNASASFRRGLLSIVGRGDLVLTLGLPLVDGLSVRQLGGVLAHEFGHFAQGSSMRLTFLVRSVNAWLARVAYERDSWDQGLIRASRNAPWQIAIMLKVAILTVALTRKLLVGLTITGHAIGTFLLREMELDADRYGTIVAGSDVFEMTAMRLRELSFARGQALAVSGSEWREGRLCEDFPGLVVALADRLPAEARRQLYAAKPQANVFDTHPPDDRRIALAAAAAEPGLLRLEAPAAALLGASSSLPRRVSLAFYQQDGGAAAGRGQLRPLSELLERLDAKINEAKAGAVYFGDVFDLLSPLGVPPRAAAPTSLADGLEALREAVEVASRLRPSPGGEAAASASETATASRPDEGKMAAARAAARERVAAALALLDVAEVRERLKTPAEIEAELARLVPTLGAFALHGASIKNIAIEHDALVELFGLISRLPDDPGLASRATHALASLHALTLKLERDLSATPYPFETVHAGLSLGAFVAQGLPETDGVSPSVHGRTRAVLGRLSALQGRAMGRLAVVAQRIERAAGFEPVPPDA
jgi:Zn-dependent protease with chaperone function